MTLKWTVNYQPFTEQIAFHKDRTKYFARLISAGTGGGKTYAGGYEAFIWAWKYPGSVGYAFEPTFKMVKRILVPTLEKMFCRPLESFPFIREYNRTDSRIEFVNGSQLWMIGLDDPESAEGPNVDWIWSDETRLVRDLETAWQVWMRRLRGSVPGKYPVGIWCTTTPDAPGSFLFKMFEDPETRLENSRVYRWNIDANPHLTDEYRESVKAAHTGGLYERFVLGRFAAVASGSFAFDYTVHVVSETPELKYVRYGVDFGWTNPSAIVAVGFDGDGRAYVLDEFYQRHVRVEDLIREAKQMQKEYGDGLFICDRSEPRTINEMKRAGLKAQSYTGKRDESIREVGGRLEKAGDGKPRLFIHRRCVNLISEMQVFDADKKENDHAVDALRYAVAVSRKKRIKYRRIVI